MNREDKLLNDLASRVFHPTERALGAYKGKKDAENVTFYHDRLILTTERVIIWIRNVGSDSIEFAPYTAIRGVRVESKFFNRSLVILLHQQPHTFSFGAKKYNEISFNVMSKKNAEHARQLILNQLQAQVTPDAGISGTQDPITILQKRFALGEITQQEYEHKMNILQPHPAAAPVNPTPQEKHCPSCNQGNEKAAMFCINCGMKL